MKKFPYFFLFILVFLPKQQYACDACGCGAGSFYFGAMPQYHKNYIGLRYRQFSFDSNPNQSTQSQEHFRITELMARAYYHNWQVQVFVPYMMNEQQSKKSNFKGNGLGDPSLLISYQLINTSKDTTVCRKFSHNFLIGAGAKAPLGKSNLTNEEGNLPNPNIQLGTGSWDVLTWAQYIVRHKKWGSSLNILYKYNTFNKNEYRFGNQFTANASLFYASQIKNIGFMLSANTQYEQRKLDISKGVYMHGTSGHQVSEILAADIYYKRFTLGGNFQIPVYQAFGEGELISRPRWSVQAGVLF